MITMVAIAMALSLTMALGGAASHYLDGQVEMMAVNHSMAVSGLGLEKIGSSAILYGMISNDGTGELELSSVSLIAPDAGRCAGDSCTLSASLPNGEAVCQIGTPPACETCTISCTLHPGESMDIGPSIHGIDLVAGGQYGVVIGVVTPQEYAFTGIHTVLVR